MTSSNSLYLEDKITGLEREQLNRVLLYFNEEALKNEAIFGIYHGSDKFDDHHIRANKEGLELYALQLLKAAREIGDAEKPGLRHLPLVCHEKWISSDSDIVIEHVEITTERIPEMPKAAGSNPVVTAFGFAGCFGIMLLILVSLVVGFVVVFNWLF